MAVVSMKQLLEAGVHFGHQTKRWNPKMAKYIFGQRNGIHIIDLQKTVKKIKDAYKFIVDKVANGEYVLFVGTKKQAQESIGQEAQRCGMFYVNQRWLGGILTNFATIRKSIMRLKELEEAKNNGRMDLLPKKEQIKLEKERVKLEKLLGGIKGMGRLPGIVFIIDPSIEEIAVREANKMEIRVVGIVDTNCDPDKIDFIIPANDDAIRAVKLLTSIVSDAVLEGKQLMKEQEPAAASSTSKKEEKAKQNVEDGKDLLHETDKSFTEVEEGI